MSFPLNQTQTLELIVCLTTISHIYFQSRDIKKVSKIAWSEGGAVIPSSLPTSLIGRIVTPTHGVAIMLPPPLYTFTVLVNGLDQPEWLASWKLPLNVGDNEPRIRIAACLVTIGLSMFTGAIFKHLGKQWHYLGVREKSSVVSTGPYAFVRHPGYLQVLAQQAIFTLMFWSLIPLIAMGITVTAFAIKIPIEEQCLLDNPKIGPDYAKYQKKVGWRLVPFVW
ncbi:hypothetical protein BDZ94DRAFT_1284809 [Collybia nuda]|uniref:Protein-S-isoprenylcysteine O-methyltransferase n=1 Tax=Collybia nuda TaxID=64659 RepID=A0A9P5XXD7_9AGAR|nr:hypothetical protein BDZ94DRAFT_1284809 [Collybia nuda]